MTYFKSAAEYEAWINACAAESAKDMPAAIDRLYIDYYNGYNSPSPGGDNWNVCEKE